MIDHIMPWRYGGWTVVQNLQTLCAFCNGRKGCRLEFIGDWRARVHQDPFPAPIFPEQLSSGDGLLHSLRREAA